MKLLSDGELIPSLLLRNFVMMTLATNTHGDDVTKQRTLVGDE